MINIWAGIIALVLITVLLIWILVEIPVENPHNIEDDDESLV